MNQSIAIHSTVQEILELQIGLRGFNSNNLVSCYVYESTSAQNQVQRGHTEAKKQENNKINWHETIKIEYDFNEYQTLYFHVEESQKSHLPIQTSQMLGKATATLSQLLHSLTRLKIGQYTLLVLVEKCKSEIVQTQLNWQWGGSNLPNMDWFSKSDPLATFYKFGQNKKKIKVYETEVIHNNNDPHWKTWNTTAEKLCPIEDNFYVEISHQERIGKNQQIGWAEISMKEILEENKTSFQIHNKKNKGQLKLLKKEVEHTNTVRTEITFVDYIRTGYNILPIFGVDCCGDYGYHEMLHGFIEILSNYNKQHYAEVYGLVGDKCIQQSLEDVKKCSHVEKAEQLNLSKFIEIVSGQTSSHMKWDSYTVAVLLINNEIGDLETVKKKLQEIEHMPLSFILVGNNPGLNMISGNDITNTLKEVPEQYIKYMNRTKKLPKERMIMSILDI